MIIISYIYILEWHNFHNTRVSQKVYSLYTVWYIKPHQTISKTLSCLNVLYCDNDMFIEYKQYITQFLIGYKKKIQVLNIALQGLSEDQHLTFCGRLF